MPVMTAKPKYPCGKCGKRATAEQMLYSRFTHARYCTDLDACARRAAKRKRKES